MIDFRSKNHHLSLLPFSQCAPLGCAIVSRIRSSESGPQRRGKASADLVAMGHRGMGVQHGGPGRCDEADTLGAIDDRMEVHR